MILIIFGVLLAFNYYIRVKTMKYFRYLMDERIKFRSLDIFSSRHWKERVISRYPEHQNTLNKFRSHILNTGFVFIFIILLAVFLFYVTGL